MKYSHLLLTSLVPAALLASPATMADEEADWLNSIKETPAKAAPAPAPAPKPKAESEKTTSTVSKKSGTLKSSKSISQADDDAKPAREIKPGDPLSLEDAPVGPRLAETDPETNEYGTLNELNATSLRAHAKNHLKRGHLQTARKLIERSIELDGENTDSRRIYAECLTEIVKKQHPRDPHTYNMCVKQWYYLTKHAEFPEEGTEACEQLKQLTGHAPAVWLRAKAYLSKVLMDEGSMTAAEIAAEEPAQVH